MPERLASREPPGHATGVMSAEHQLHARDCRFRHQLRGTPPDARTDCTMPVKRFQPLNVPKLMVIFLPCADARLHRKASVRSGVRMVAMAYAGPA